MVFQIYYYTLFNILYTIRKFIYISYTTIMVYEKEAKKKLWYMRNTGTFLWYMRYFPLFYFPLDIFLMDPGPRWRGPQVGEESKPGPSSSCNSQPHPLLPAQWVYKDIGGQRTESHCARHS
jgi:hypothetical protein